MCIAVAVTATMNMSFQDSGRCILHSLLIKTGNKVAPCRCISVPHPALLILPVKPSAIHSALPKPLSGKSAPFNHTDCQLIDLTAAVKSSGANIYGGGEHGKLFKAVAVIKCIPADFLYCRRKAYLPDAGTAGRRVFICALFLRSAVLRPYFPLRLVPHIL